MIAHFDRENSFATQSVISRLAGMNIRVQRSSYSDCRLGHPVGHRTSFRFATPQNGNFLRNCERFSARIRNFGSNPRFSETNRRVKSAGNTRFLTHLADRKAETGLAGWRPSAGGTLLRPFSLLTGNFAKSWLPARQGLQIVASP